MISPFEFGCVVAHHNSRQKTAAGLGSIGRSMGNMFGGMFGGAAKAAPPPKAIAAAPTPKLDIATASPAVRGPLAAARGVQLPSEYMAETFKQVGVRPPARPPGQRPTMGGGHWIRVKDKAVTPEQQQALEAATARWQEAMKLREQYSQ